MRLSNWSEPSQKSLFNIVLYLFSKLYYINTIESIDHSLKPYNQNNKN